MPRSAADATRFTATRPHAYSKPTSTPAARLRPQNSTARSTTIDPPPSASSSSAASTIDIPDPASATETPQQKVARLRAAAARARAAQESTFDRVLSRGRVWADRAHRVTVMGFVGLSGTLPFPAYPRNGVGRFITYGGGLTRDSVLHGPGTLRYRRHDAVQPAEAARVPRGAAGELRGCVAEGVCC